MHASRYPPPPMQDRFVSDQGSASWKTVVQLAFWALWTLGSCKGSAPPSAPFDFAGRIHFDAGAFDVDRLERRAGERFDEWVELRRMRLEASGKLGPEDSFAGDWHWRSQWELSNRDFFLHDAWLEYRGLELGRLRAGRFRQPQGLEALTSSKAVPLMERAAPMDALTAGRDKGVMLHDVWGAQDGTWAVGVFSPAETIDDDVHGDALEYVARSTWLAWRGEEGDQRLLHLGASLATRDSRDGQLRFRARPEAHLAPRLIDTGELHAEGAHTAGLEFLWIDGPRSLQAELLGTRVDLDDGQEADFLGYYLLATWTLTGESRSYKHSKGSLNKLVPSAPRTAGGPGAWELAARYSRVDLSDAPVAGGQQDDWTLGLNWYATEAVRLMANWVHSEQDDLGASGDLFLLRLQVDF